MGNDDRTQQTATLGCGSLILIALIVLLFGKSSTQDLEKEIKSLSAEVKELKQAVEAETARVKELRDNLEKEKSK